MGAAGETGTTAAVSKASKGGAAAAAVIAAPPSTYAEWAAAFQAYYSAAGQTPPGAAFAGHPYMWGGQPMMPPYGTPHPQYGAMYHPAGMYAHPAMYGQYGLQSDTMVNSDQTETKPELKDTDSGKNQAQKQSPLKRSQGSKGSLALMIGGKGSEGEKGNGGVVMSQSSNGDENENESGSEGSTGGSDENKNEQHNRQKVNLGEVATDATGVGSYGAHPVQSVSGTPAAGGSLDMSLDHWNAGNAPVKTGKQMSASPSVNATPPADHWLQDEREVKRQRRKQSNRESARRSRLRKQAECEELGARVDTLAVENLALRNELAWFSEECKRLEAANASLVEQMRNTSKDVADTSANPEASAVVGQDAPTNKHEETESKSQGNGNVKRTDNTPAGALFDFTLNVFADPLFLHFFLVDMSWSRPVGDSTGFNTILKV